MVSRVGSHQLEPSLAAAYLLPLEYAERSDATRKRGHCNSAYNSGLSMNRCILELAK